MSSCSISEKTKQMQQCLEPRIQATYGGYAPCVRAATKCKVTGGRRRRSRRKSRRKSRKSRRKRRKSRKKRKKSRRRRRRRR